MRKLYMYFASLFLLGQVAMAQYQVNGTAVPQPEPGFPNQFLITTKVNNSKGSVFNLNALDLSQSFILNTQLYLGANDDSADGMAFVIQREGSSYLGNSGAGLGYHRFSTDVPGPVPSFIVEFDTYQNGFVAGADVGDPAQDHLAFMSHSNAYHTSSDALSSPYLLPNVEDDSWHPARFAWNATTNTFTVDFLGNTYTWSGNLGALVGGSTGAFWGFTAGSGHAPNEHKVRVISLVTGNQSPLTITGTVANTSCTSGGGVDISVSGGTGPYTYVWSNGATTQDLTNVPANTYTVTVTDAFGTTSQSSFTVANGCVNTPITITGTTTNASCGSGGSVDISVSGGHPPYTYLWSNGATTQDLSNVGPGNYTVTVKDASNTTKQVTFTVANGADHTPPQITCPGTETECFNILSYYNIAPLVATDNCGIASINYVITGATSRSGTGKNATGFFSPGTSTIKWTVKDLSGNVSTCTSQVIVNKVSVDIPDVYAVNPGGEANTIYLGYGATSLTLTAVGSGGTGPYTYLWSTGATTPSITVSPSYPGIYPYLVVVKDANGCAFIGVQLVKVVDVRCGNGKVTVCHIPPGNPRNANEICVSKNAVPDHLAHGDHLGQCNNDYDNNHWNKVKPAAPVVEAENTVAAGAYPNPTPGRFNLKLDRLQAGEAQVMIYNSNGLVVEKRSVQITGKEQTLNFDLSTRTAGIYLVKIISKDGIQTQKIVVQR